MFIVRIKENKEQPILAGHPWIFAGAVDRVDSHSDKYTCRVLDSKGRFVCQGFYNPYSQIAVRVLTLGRDTIDKEMFAGRIDKAILLRQGIIPEATTCYRLINSEGDRLPGLVADRYGKVIVIQFLCLAMEKFRDDIIDLFKSRYPGYAIHERSDPVIPAMQYMRDRMPNPGRQKDWICSRVPFLGHCRKEILKFWRKA